MGYKEMFIAPLLSPEQEVKFLFGNESLGY